MAGRIRKTASFNRGFRNTQQTTDINEQVFTSSGTWTKPAGALITYIYCVGGGGGGGAGGVGATYDSGGAGGAGGGCDLQMYISASLSNTLTVTVGAGSNGGAATSAGNARGNDPGAGGISKVVDGTNDLVCHGDGGYGGHGGGAYYAAAGAVPDRGLFAGSVADQSYGSGIPGSGGWGNDGSVGQSGNPGWGPGGGGGGTEYSGSGTNTFPGQGGKGSVYFNGIKPSGTTYAHGGGQQIAGFQQASNSFAGSAAANWSYFAPTSHTRQKYGNNTNRYYYQTNMGGGGLAGAGATMGAAGGNGIDVE